MTNAFYLALVVAGGLLSGPIWMHYERRCSAQRREWEARRRERELRVTLDRTRADTAFDWEIDVPIGHGW